MSYEILQNVSMPNKPSDKKFPLGEMIVGDMFKLPESERSVLSVYISKYQKKHPGVKFKTRKLQNGVVGAWRVE